MAISKARLRNVPSVPSLVPGLFPVWGNEFLVFPSLCVSSVDLIDGIPALPSLNGHGTLGTLGTQLIWSKLRRSDGRNRRGTLGSPNTRRRVPCVHCRLLRSGYGDLTPEPTNHASLGSFLLNRIEPRISYYRA
jgi:hypothetical protein